ncbi:uncharacterized protein B0J16DRAFT_360480 [Fusarium flagelliforme]|uniref:uncharacterized protein n=1 Tax=Fusarium flagelliforme TaxID=2675880 RepID=UPI001E8E7E7F|nr:uncharacterized protein B0J16DRAFT_360480 [Fusarium flagelliforme]KAH7198805.1 hypothetical protein B0J16DRAFT_360480 [Fusarium flagelliforme]
MEQGYSQPHTVPTLSDLGHKSEAALDQIVKYAETLNSGTLCVTLEDEQGRFRIWASNLGALQPADSTKSLDRRLKDAPLMRKSVASGLERLELSAKRALAILNKSTPNRSISGGDAQPTTELDELLLSLRSAVNHLFGLSMLIRRQRPKGRLPELEELVLESSPDISYLTDKFPKAKSNLWLARRLGNNITRQRRLIQYRQHHRESLAKRDVKSSDPTDAATIVATTFHEGDKSSGIHPTPQDADSSRMSIFTSATSFLSLEDGTTTGRSIPDLSDMTLDGVQLDYGEPFECPYCRTIQNAMNRYEWKRHVFTDLQPYVCTFEDCAISNRSFPTRAAWFQHECTVHRLQWNCNWCSQSDTTFHSAKDLKKHLDNTHSGMVTEAQMPMILETCERPIKSFGSDSCPLCADWEPPSTKENVKSFSRHLARHLQQLALEALPLAIDGLEIKDTSGLSDKESSLSYGSGDEEATRNQPDDGPPAIIQGEDGQLAADMAAGLDDTGFNPDIVIDDPTYSRRDSLPGVQGADSDSHSEPSSKAPVAPEATESVKIEEDIEGPEAAVVETTANRAEHSRPLAEEQLIEEENNNISRIVAEFNPAVKAKAVAKSATEDHKKSLEEEAKAQLQDFKKKAEKAPIRFKDAVGRKFSFPFHLCATWQGMEELIKQAFMQVDVLGPHVMEGHYDLMGPDAGYGDYYGNVANG